MPRLLPLAALLPLLATLALAQPPVPKEQPKKLTEEEKKEKLKEAKQYGDETIGLEFDGKFKEALATAEKVLAAERQVYGTAHEEIVGTLTMIGRIQMRLGAWAAARATFRERVEVRVALSGQDHWLATDARLTLADVDRFEALTAEDRDALRTAATSWVVAVAMLNQRRFTEARPRMEEVLTVRKKLLGDSHRDTLTSLHGLARLSSDQLRNADAEKLHEAALAGRKKLLGDAHPDTLTTLNDLGVLYMEQGRPADAEPLLVLALAGNRKCHGDLHRNTLFSLNNLAVLYDDTGEEAKAEPLLKEAVATCKKVFGEEHPSTLTSMNNLGVLYRNQGSYDEAEKLFTAALAGRKKALGDTHPDTLTSLNNYAMLLKERGRFADAEPLYKGCIAASKETVGDSHPRTLTGVHNLAVLYAMQGRLAEAKPLYAEVLAGTRRQFDRAAVGQTEAQQLRLRTTLRHRLDLFLSGDAVDRHSTDRYAEVLGWKGSAFARQAQTRLAVLGTNDAALAKLFAARSDAARQFANLTAATPSVDRIADHGKTLKAAADRTDEIDRELARKCEPFRKTRETAALTPDQLAKSLPADVALVDYLEYRHFVPDLDKKGQWKLDQRFLAFVVRNGQPVVEVELKAAAPIAEAVTAWRQVIERGAGNGEAAATLRKLVWEPLAKHLGEAKTVLISPDGALGRLPFAALPGSDPKKYLIEEVAIAVVPVPQLIPELLSAKPNTAKPSLLVVGGVDFDADAGTPTAGTEARAAVRGGSAGKWGALAGTSDEAKAVANAFVKQFPDGKTTSLTGIGATEAAIRDGITGRRVLHFATHGFFAPPPPEPKEPVGLRAETFDRDRVAGVHPGLQCGLVLAGANKPPKVGSDDGILTALEVAGLDLRGVELAVLSACETGLGKESGGEGVLGLQRAFQAAGAGRVVSSLWKVPDQSTAALMGRFYQHLWADKQPAAEALRRAQLELLRNPDKVAGWAKDFRGATADDGKVEATDGRLPPRAWAAFTLSGDWR